MNTRAKNNSPKPHMHRNLIPVEFPSERAEQTLHKQSDFKGRLASLAFPTGHFPLAQTWPFSFLVYFMRFSHTSLSNYLCTQANRKVIVSEYFLCQALTLDTAVVLGGVPGNWAPSDEATPPPITLRLNSRGRRNQWDGGMGEFFLHHLMCLLSLPKS